MQGIMNISIVKDVIIYFKTLIITTDLAECIQDNIVERFDGVVENLKEHL